LVGPFADLRQAFHNLAVGIVEREHVLRIEPCLIEAGADFEVENAALIEACGRDGAVGQLVGGPVPFVGKAFDQRLRQHLDCIGAMAAGDRQQHLQRGRRRVAAQIFGERLDLRGPLIVIAHIGANHLGSDHDKRTAQVKALTEYLSGNPSSAALQMLLSIARRHRTNAVQVLAQALVERLADERDWTTDELADRTIPTAGLDERGILDLEIGSRVYQARLDAEDVLTLYNPDGKVVKSLPQISEGPDKESAAEAKKTLSNAKKELKQVHELQAKRLYDALCIGRRW